MSPKYYAPRSCYAFVKDGRGAGNSENRRTAVLQGLSLHMSCWDSLAVEKLLPSEEEAKQGLDANASVPGIL